ncbi:carbon monoxide dehydrogenase, partial [Streptomyces sp. SID6137]|nr:carbon monoxide dehydrogenase [Streptomyces sp. SID6137]
MASTTSTATDARAGGDTGTATAADATTGAAIAPPAPGAPPFP